MPKPLHAIDYLSSPKKHAVRPVCVVFGDEALLKRHVLRGLRRAALGGENEADADFSFTVFEGRKATIEDVLAELSTVAMFGGGQRLVLVEEADEFVTRYRSELEDYVAKPRSTGRLMLEVRSFPGNTRLAKAVISQGLAIECNAPKAAKLTDWLVSWAGGTHRTKLARTAAEMLIEMVGPELGLLDQEVARLALLVEPGGEITAKSVQQTVGSWRAKTTWVMLDTALGGRVSEALTQLDRLLLAGESPIGLLAQISSTLRRFAAATRLILQAESLGRRLPLRTALEQAGFKSFALGKAQQQLRQLGRDRGAGLLGWLLEADLALKGASSMPPRLILERLILRLATPASRAVKA